MVAGAALENRTLLGRMVRIGIPQTDPRIAEAFARLEQRTKNDVEGKISEFRHQLTHAHSVTAEIMLALLKAGGEAK